MANPVSGFPDETNTGVQSGVSLTNYTGPMTISTDGVVIENKIIDGSLRITGDNVTIKNCIITYNGMWGIDAEGARNILVQNCEIVGPGSGGDSNSGILGSGTFLYNNIYNSENGITLQDGASIVRGNYIHDLLDNSSDPHYDGISVQGGQDGVLIEGNTIVGRDTSNIFIKNDFGPINDVIVRNNLMYGDAGYVVYVDGRASGGPITNVSITGNYIEEGYYGTFSVDKASPTISDNIMFTPGDNVAGPTSTTTTSPTEPLVQEDTTVPDASSDSGSSDSVQSDGSPTTTEAPTDMQLLGTRGNDVLTGGAGNDYLLGRKGADLLTGGEGADQFVFKSVSHSTVDPSGRDTILDFNRSQGDKINLEAIDAKSGRGNQAFEFVGDAAFSKTKGELRYEKQGDSTFVYGDVNGDGKADFAIKLLGSMDLHASDFVL